MNMFKWGFLKLFIIAVFVAIMLMLPNHLTTNSDSDVPIDVVAGYILLFLGLVKVIALLTLPVVAEMIIKWSLSKPYRYGMMIVMSLLLLYQGANGIMAWRMVDFAHFNTAPLLGEQVGKIILVVWIAICVIQLGLMWLSKWQRIKSAKKTAATIE